MPNFRSAVSMRRSFARLLERQENRRTRRLPACRSDPAKRRSIIAEIWKASAEFVPYSMLYNEVQAYGVRAGVKWQPRPDERLLFGDAEAASEQQASAADAPGERSMIRVDPVTTALVVVDMQNDFCSADGYYATVGRDISNSPHVPGRLPRCWHAHGRRG